MNLVYRNCPVCNSQSYVDTGNRTREFPEANPMVVRCVECNIIYLNPVMSEEDNNVFYNADSQKVFADLLVKENYDEKVRKDDIRRYNMIYKYVIKSYRMLDVGSGNSRLVRMIPIMATGIDINKDRCLRSRVNGVCVIHSDIYHWNPKEDLITMFHLLEHILDPMPFLQKARDILTHKGILVIEVPNHNDILVNLPSYKKFYYQMAHCTYFTPQTLENVITNCGFKVIRTKRLQRYSLDNHMNWLLTGKSGTIAGLKPFNFLYSSVIKLLGYHDTIFMVCEKI